jgi:hypothetical protein
MLLQLLARYRSFSRAQSMIDAASPQQADHDWVCEYQAQIHVETGEHEHALSILTPEFMAACENQASARNMHRLRGKSLEAIGNYIEAHESFDTMNRIAAASYSAPESTDIVAAWSGMALDDLPKIPADETESVCPGIHDRIPPFRHNPAGDHPRYAEGYKDFK